MGGQQQEVCTLLLMGGQQEDTRHWACLAPRECQRLEPQAGVLGLLDRQEAVQEVLEAPGAREETQEAREVQEALGAQEEASRVQEVVLVQLGPLLFSQLWWHPGWMRRSSPSMKETTWHSEQTSR